MLRTQGRAHDAGEVPVTRREPIPFVYRLVMLVAGPLLRWWGRLEVIGAAAVPDRGGVLVIANHDSMWDPVAVGVAAPNRQIRALAKASLWHNPVLSWVLRRMGQIPIERGRADLAAMSLAVDALTGGGCVGMFPEGTRSMGRTLRPLSGAGRLAQAVPDAALVCVAVRGVVDIARFPRRPRVQVEFFRPDGVEPRSEHSAIGLSRELMRQVRARAPHAVAGRRTPS